MPLPAIPRGSITGGTNAVIDPIAMPLPDAPRRRVRGPDWVRLLLTNPKSCFGIVTIVGMVVVALLAPVIAEHSPTEIVGLRASRRTGSSGSAPPTRATTSSPRSIWGARISLAVGAAAAVISTVIAATLGMLAAYAGGWVDDTINLLTNIFLVIPALPLLLVVYSFLPARGPAVMILILGLTTWAVEARILRGQALSLRNRDFVLAAKVAGERTWRVVFGEIMPNMISRIAAGFLLVFYLVDHLRGGTRVPRLRRRQQDDLGDDAVLGPEQLLRPPGRLVALRLPRRGARARGRRARLRQLRGRRAREPAPAPAHAEAAPVAAGAAAPRRRARAARAEGAP